MVRSLLVGLSNRRCAMRIQVSKLGFGCMGLTGVYNTPVPEETGIAIIRHAFEAGITFFDTADAYGPHTNEVLLGKVKSF